MTLRNEIKEYVKEKYGTEAECLWRSYPSYEVLRHEAVPGEKKAKWYGIIMDVKRSALGLSGEDFVDILNIRTDPETAGFLRQAAGFLPPYHMGKQTGWVSILLDGTVSMDNIRQQIDISFDMTASDREKGGKKSAVRGKRDWIVPANPIYYDLIAAFAMQDTIVWKQSSSVQGGDQVYMYVAAPYSALMYRCEAVETDIPWDYTDRDLVVKKVMRIRLMASYGADFMPLSRMREEFGVYAVRGPRSMPNSLKEELNAYEGEL